MIDHEFLEVGKPRLHLVQLHTFALKSTGNDLPLKDIAHRSDSLVEVIDLRRKRLPLDGSALYHVLF